MPFKFVNSGPSLLSKNLENAISQNGKSEKYFYAPFLIHMVVEFQKSKLPILLHFVQVKLPYQPHVKILEVIAMTQKLAKCAQTDTYSLLQARLGVQSRVLYNS